MQHSFYIHLVKRNNFLWPELVTKNMSICTRTGFERYVERSSHFNYEDLASLFVAGRLCGKRVYLPPYKGLQPPARNKCVLIIQKPGRFM